MTKIKVKGVEIVLSADQEAALDIVFEQLLSGKEASLAGAAGTGKTTVMKAVIDRWRRLKKSAVFLAAPTGRAANQLAATTGGHARTIHSMFYGGVEDDERGVKGPEFTDPRPPEGCVPADLVIIDESSMVDRPIAALIRLQVLENARAHLLWVGDHEQLSPIRRGGWGVDLANATAKLTKVHRQALDSAVLELATCFRERRAHEFTRWGDEVNLVPNARVEDAVDWMEDFHKAEALLAFAPPEAAKAARRSRILLTWRNAIRRETNRITRQKRRYEIGEVHTGETLLCRANSHATGLMNGETFVVDQVRPCAPLTKCLGHEVNWVREFVEVPTYFTNRRGKRIQRNPGREFLIIPKLFDVEHPDLNERGLFRALWKPLWAKKQPDREGEENAWNLLRRMGWTWDDLHHWRGESKRYGLQATWGYCMTVHACVHPDTLIETPEGLLHMWESGSSGTVATPGGSREFTGRITNPVGAALRVTTEGGYTLTITPDHGLDVWDGSSYCRKAGALLSSGDWLRFRLGQTCEDPAPHPLPPPFIGDSREKSLQFPLFMTPALAEWWGMMTADGTVFSRGLRLGKSKKDVMERFSHLMEELFGYEAVVSKDSSGKYKVPYWTVEVASSALSSWVARVGGLESRRKFVPRAIRCSSLTCQAAYLRGIWIDGSVHVKDGVLDHLELEQRHHGLVPVLRTMLLQQGIPSGRGWGSKRYDNLQVYGYYAKLFLRRIGFLPRDHREAAVESKGRDQRQRTRFPVDEECILRAGSEGKLSSLGGGRWRSVLSNWRQVGGYISYETARLIPELDLDWYHQRVKYIEPVECPSMCLTVPEGHRFLQNGCAGWNSQGSQYEDVGFISCSAYRRAGRPGDRFLGPDEKRRMAYTAVTRAQKRFRAFMVQ